MTLQINQLFRRLPVRSLGASGAVSGALAAFCFIFPDASLAFFGLSALSLPAEQALQVIVAIELGMLIFLARRIPIDCAAHLGGFAFGYGYATYLYQTRRMGRRQPVC